ncbi:MAG: hypothetical protein LBM96_03735 [Methanobrevibacter sp.]|nr:hypothetical protein [Candidatus Methanoflexus mossambicus]
MNILSQEAGFDIKYTIFDSDYQQFVKSEEYKNNIAMNDDKSLFRSFFYLTNKNRLKNSIFSFNDIKKFKSKSIELNSKMEGDHAIFVLKTKT